MKTPKPPKKATPKGPPSKPPKKASTTPADAPDDAQHTAPVAAPAPTKRGRRPKASPPPAADVATPAIDAREAPAVAADADDDVGAAPFDLDNDRERDVATPARPAVVTSPRPEVVTVTRPEEALPAGLLLAALRFVLPAAAVKGEMHQILFTEEEGLALVVARGPERLHVAYLPPVADWRVRGVAAPESARKLCRLLAATDETDQATATGTALGYVTIRRTGQPALAHALDTAPAVLDWRPPFDGREATAFPLLLSADQLLKAVRYPGGTVEIEQRSSARAILTIKAGGVLAARAWLAEKGHKLYPEPEPAPPAQGRLPGFDLGAARASAAATKPAATTPAVAAPAVAVVAPARPAPPLPPFPSLRDDGRAELRFDQQTWDALPAATHEALADLPWLTSRVDGTYLLLGPVNPPEAAAVGELLAAAGLRCSDTLAGADGVETWFVASAAPRPEAPTPFGLRPPAGPLVVAVLRRAWDFLPDEARALLEGVTGVVWADCGADRATAPLDAPTAAALLPRLEAAGLALVDRLDPTLDEPEEWRFTGATAPRVDDAELRAFPEPGSRPVVVEIPEALWDELTPHQLVELHTPTKRSASWLTGSTSTSSTMLAAPEAIAVGGLLAGWSYRCEREEDGTRYGAEVTTWHVGRAGEKGAAV